MLQNTHAGRQAVQKCLDARRAWFDKLTMTICSACPELAEGRFAAQLEQTGIFQLPV